MQPLSLAAKMKIRTHKRVRFAGISGACTRMFLHLDLAARWHLVGADGFSLTMEDPFLKVMKLRARDLPLLSKNEMGRISCF